MSTGPGTSGGAPGEAGTCPDGHHVPAGVRFCPVCGRYVGPALEDTTWTPDERHVPRRRASRWPGRILVGIGLVALVGFVVALVRMGPGGTEDLVADPLPTTTLAPTTTLPPVDGQPCSVPGARAAASWCEPTAAGPVWRPAPFAGPGDVVGLVGLWPVGTAVPSDALVRIGDVAVAAGNPAEREAGGARLWCVAVILQNRATTTLTYDPDQLRLLDPAGNLTPTASGAGLEPAPLGRGELLPGGTVTSYACFPSPSAGAGRYAVAYQPPGTLGRALLYVDR